MLRSDDYRLVTVTGAGGVGKTSLALAVTETLLGEFPDGAFFVSLAEVPTAEGVSAAIAGPLGITAGEGSDLGERIAAGLANRRLLLLLDNFEHVIEAAMLVDRMLDAAPGVRLVITSQTPLHLRRERVFVLGPLALPSEDTVASVTQSTAGQLLLLRTQDPAASETLTPKTAVPLARLCRLLQGSPLAIELAAARLNAIRQRMS